MACGRKKRERWVGSLSTNERCPCGSGNQYERCCSRKSLRYEADDDAGEVVRAVALNHEARAELEAAMAVQRETFIAKFGREPGCSSGNGCDRTRELPAETITRRPGRLPSHT